MLRMTTLCDFKFVLFSRSDIRGGGGLSELSEDGNVVLATQTSLCN
jgi:hypothetical protein